MRFSVSQSENSKGKMEYFATGNFKDPEGVMVPYSKWLSDELLLG